MQIKITALLDAEISNDELASALFRAAIKLGGLDDIDDAGCDWFTDHHGRTYIGGADWIVSRNPQVAAMIDSVNALKGYQFDGFKLSDSVVTEAKAQADRERAAWEEADRIERERFQSAPDWP